MKNKNKRFSGSSVRNTVTSFVFGAILFSMLTAYFMPPIYAPSYTSGVNCTDTTLAGCSLQYNGSDELVWANGLVTVNGTLNSDGAIYWDEDSNLPASTYTYIVQNNTNTVINSPSGGAVIFSVAGTNEFTITASGGITATGDSTFGNNDLSSITWLNSTNVRTTNLYPTVIDDVVTLFGHLVPSGTRDAGSQSTGFRDVFVDTILYLKTGLVIKINGGGDPTLATITYSATEPTIAWNTSSSHTGFNLGGAMNTKDQWIQSDTHTYIRAKSDNTGNIYLNAGGVDKITITAININVGATMDFQDNVADNFGGFTGIVGNTALYTDSAAASTLQIYARDIDNVAWRSFISLTSANVPSINIGITDSSTQTLTGTWATSSFTLGATTFSGAVNQTVLSYQSHSNLQFTNNDARLAWKDSLGVARDTFYVSSGDVVVILDMAGNTAISIADDSGGITFGDTLVNVAIGSNVDWNSYLITELGGLYINSGGYIKSQSGGSPSIVTLNYPGSWTGVAWNSSWFHTGFVLGGIMDANGQDITDVDSLEGENGQVLTIYGRHSSVGLNTILINTRNAASAETTRLAFTGKQDSSYMIMSAMDFVPSTNNTLLIGNSTKQFSDGYFVNLHLKNAATVGHIVFAGDGLDWTLTEASKLGDSGEGLVLIDGLIGSEYTRIFEVNENGVYHLGDKLASDSRVDQLEQRIAELEQLISELRG